MASSAKHFSLILVLTLLSSLQIHARDSQFFNKIPSTTNKNVVPIDKEAQNNQQERQDPNFLPENGNGYGLYGHESGQLPPSATTGEPAAAATTTTTPLNAESKQPVNKYLPKNYNPVAYVTVPEDMSDSTKFTEENNYKNSNNNNENNFYNGEESNNNNQQQEEEFEETEYRGNPTTTTTDAAPKNNVYYNSASVFRSRDRYSTYGGEANGFQPQGMSDTRSNGGSTFNSRAYGGEPNGFQPQGLSDTRNLENGRYFYDLNTEKYSSSHPYESLKGLRAEYNNRNFNGDNENYEFNNENSINGGYQNQEEFQLDNNNAMP